MRDHITSYNKRVNTNLNKPLQETPIIDQRTPLAQIPVHILQCINVQARFPTEKNNNALCFSRYKPKQEHISASTIVTFKDGLS